MTCKDCIHSGLCYKKNDYENFPNRCGDFISDKVLEERPQGEWITTKVDTDLDDTVCSICGKSCEDIEGTPHKTNFCPNCGAKMKKETDIYGNT